MISRSHSLRGGTEGGHARRPDAQELHAKQMAHLRQDRGEVTVTIARRELRKWLRESTEGKAVEEAVEKLLITEQMPTNPPPGGH